MDQPADGQQRGGVDMSVTPGQSITKTQLDELATLANAKLPLRLVRFDGPTAQRNFEFNSTGWLTELRRMRQNLSLWLGDFGAAQGYRPGVETYVSGPWAVYGIARGAGNYIWAKRITKRRNTATYLSHSATVQISFRNTDSFGNPIGSDTILPVVRQVYPNAISTATVYSYTFSVPETEQNYSAVVASEVLAGVWLVNTQTFSPNMNPFSTASPFVNYDERITRFANVQHRALMPYAELPTPYPPADITYEEEQFSGRQIPISYSQHYDGLAEYFYGIAPDIRGPKSPSASSYFRVPCYPIRKRSDGVYAPFTSESVSGVGDFGAVIKHGMVYSITISRADYDESATVTFGNFHGQAWVPIQTTTLSGGERSKTVYVRWPVFSDAPVYWDSESDLHIQPTFTYRGQEGDASQFGVTFPIHSCHYNDTEAILNTLP